MPVTKTAKRALRVSRRKTAVNKELTSRLEIALRKAYSKGAKKEVLREASSLADRAVKAKLIHKNKAARIKSRLSKLGSKSK